VAGRSRQLTCKAREGFLRAGPDLFVPGGRVGAKRLEHIAFMLIDQETQIAGTRRRRRTDLYLLPLLVKTLVNQAAGHRSH
jgi:hypothetical protein